MIREFKLLGKCWFYYPMPNVIYLPKTDDLFDIYSPNFDQDRYALFNEREAFKNIIFC